MRMCSALAGLGIRVSLAERQGLKGVDPFSFYGVKANFRLLGQPRVPFRRLRGACRLISLRRQAWGSSRPDVVYARDLYSLLPLIGTRLPVIFEIHHPPWQRTKRMLEPRLLSSSMVIEVVFITQALREHYLATYPELNSKVTIVAPSGLEIRQRNSQREPTDQSARPRVGYVGHLYPGRAEIILKIAPLVPSADFILVGGRAVDRQTWQERGLPENVFLFGSVAPSEVPSVLDSFALVLAPYQQSVLHRGGDLETSRWMSPLKIMEYLGCGKAIVASDLPAIREVLTHGESAVLCPPERADHWAAAIHELLLDLDKRQALEQGASRNAQAFTWSRRASHIIAMFEGSVGESRGRKHFNTRSGK